MHWFLIYVTVGWLIRLAMVPAVLRRQFTPGASVAWLGIVFLHPYIGLALYLVFSESRLGPGRVVHYTKLTTQYAVADAPAEMPAGSRPLGRLAEKVGRMPAVPGSAVEFFTDSATTVGRLVADIESATSHVHLLYYILAGDSTGARIIAALGAAAQRGVKCRVLLDGFASRAAFGRHGFASQLRASGCEVAAALPSSPLRRRDLRNHRKLTVIDDRLAYAGSQNLINPDYGGKHGGPWVDLTGRFTGPIVAELATVFVIDWAFETNQELAAPPPGQIAKIEGGIPMQVVPTGPVTTGDNFRRLFLGVVDSAQQRLVLTTPYFVPDGATLLALLTAADRGVDVSLILPETSDNMFTAAAGRAHYAALLDAGIAIYLFRPGLLHTKLVTVDGSVAVFGSANLDIRSFHLNFELTTLLYGEEVTGRLEAVQQNYIAHSQKLGAKQWAARPAIASYADSAVALISPLL